MTHGDPAIGKLTGDVDGRTFGDQVARFDDLTATLLQMSSDAGGDFDGNE